MILAYSALGMIAFFAGIFLSSRFWMWVVTVYFTLRGKDAPVGGSANLTRFVSVTLLHSGPWLVTAVAIFAFYVHSKPWAAWVFGGALIGMLYHLVVGLSLIRKRRRKRKENAA